MRNTLRLVTLTVVTLGALTAFVACGSSSSPSPVTPVPSGGNPAPGGGGGGNANVTAGIVSFSFSPNPVTVQVGQSIAWSNSDSVAHTATADSGSFDTGNIAPGATSAPMTMSTAGTITYHCKIHPGMVATINVQ